MASGDVYTASYRATSYSNTKVFIELKAGTTNGFEVLRIYLGQSSNTVSFMNEAIVATYTGLGTGGTSITPVSHVEGQSGTTLTSAYGALTADGTGESIILNEAFNELAGWLWVPHADERIVIKPSGILGVRYRTANYPFTAVSHITYRET